MKGDRFDPAICGVCARAAIGIGHAPPRANRILWTCNDRACLETAKRTYAMKQDQFTRIESRAAASGGEAGGAYLDQIGKYDLTTMTTDEWFEFCRRIVGGYRVALSNSLKGEAGN